jgi:hypothetical protein
MWGSPENVWNKLALHYGYYPCVSAVMSMRVNNVEFSNT